MSTYSETALIKVTFTGINGAGEVSVPGLKAGDVVLATHTGVGTWNAEFFSTYVDTDGYINQIDSGDNSAKTFTSIIARCP